MNMYPFILKVVLMEREIEEIKRREHSSYGDHPIFAWLASWARKKDSSEVSETETDKALFLKSYATGCK